MMMQTPKTIGRPTSNAARRTISRRSLLVTCPACSRRRTKFSTMTTDASTSSPKSSAPRLIRLADTSNRCIARNANEQRQRNDRRRDERRADVAQKQEQHERDEQPAFEQIREDGARRAIDDLALVVERADGDAGGQQRTDLVEALFDAAHDLAAVRALEHDDHARQRLAAAVARHGAFARHRADRHLRHVAHVDGRAAARGDDDVARCRSSSASRPRPRIVNRSPRFSMYPAPKFALLSRSAIGEVVQA